MCVLRSDRIDSGTDRRKNVLPPQSLTETAHFAILAHIKLRTRDEQTNSLGLELRMDVAHSLDGGYIHLGD